ncbi:uncharacterized protein LOC133823003 isoform X3 [Humulus lupulus]|uniref:uncharacterized protein LOC133823003 isoform X3 n=2 Tax=Humulus lupulus TaxID=3486 RepID=UPI002B413184|nr:uncharacterized protein LOC133823003 isoform X3 [Humulus lupulus]
MGIGSSFHAQETAKLHVMINGSLLECVLECYPNEVASLVDFSSTPLLEPYVIPLLLEKLSSSMPSSKLGGGYLFGLPLGFVADSIGATIGATAAFILGRTIKHAQHLTPGTADRFHELGIIASVQNLEISCLEKNLDMRLGVVTKETKPGLTVSLLYIILTENLAF